MNARRVTVLGIDPGNDGAFAVLEEAEGCPLRVAACEVLPTAQTLQGKDVVDPVALEDRLRCFGPYAMLAVEQVGSRPTDGHQGAFTFGRVVGRIENPPQGTLWQRVAAKMPNVASGVDSFVDIHARTSLCVYLLYL